MTEREEAERSGKLKLGNKNVGRERRKDEYKIKVNLHELSHANQ